MTIYEKCIIFGNAYGEMHNLLAWMISQKQIDPLWLINLLINQIY